MFRRNRIVLMILTAAAVLVLLTACGGKDSVDFEHQRELSWDGTELTIKLGENKSTGCEWTTKPQDDSVIDYSTNRVFHMSDSGLSEGQSLGTLEAGFKGKGAGTSQIICTTPVDWDGSGDGYVYIVTVTVNEDGTIENATGEESDTNPADDAEASEQSSDNGGASQAAQTLESYFAEHADELEEVQKNLSEDENYKGIVDIEVKAEGNTLSYFYTFKETYPADKVNELKASLEENLATEEMKANMSEQVKKIEIGYGVSGVKLYMEFRNGDGSKICDAEYE